MKEIQEFFPFGKIFHNCGKYLSNEVRYATFFYYYYDLVVSRLCTRADCESQAEGRGFNTNDTKIVMVIFTYSIIVIIII